MRRRDREITDMKVIESILSDARYMHLGMFDAEYPYVVPLFYGHVLQADGRLTLYAHCAKVGHKLDCITRNNRVFAVIDREESLITDDTPCLYSAKYGSIMCRGRASVVEDKEEKCRALHVLMRTQTGRDFEINENAADMVAIIRIDVDSYTAKARLR